MLTEASRSQPAGWGELLDMVLGAELRLSAKAVSSLSHLVISPVKQSHSSFLISLRELQELGLALSLRAALSFSFLSPCPLGFLNSIHGSAWKFQFQCLKCPSML